MSISSTADFSDGYGNQCGDCVVRNKPLSRQQSFKNGDNDRLGYDRLILILIDTVGTLF